MRSSDLFRLTILLLFVLPLEGLAQSSHVILITVDGLAAFHLSDHSLEIPNLRDLINHGVMAESSETVFPSVTHPSHTTLLTGKLPIDHGVLNNTMRNRVTGESYHVTNKSRAESVKVPTLFDLAKKQGLTTAAFFWPETKADPSIDFNIPEVLDAGNRPSPQALDSHFFRELRQAGVPVDLYERYYGDAELHTVADAVLAEAAAYVVQKHQPQFIAIHFLATDKAQHTYGPSHYLAKASITQVDRCIGILREAVKARGLQDRTTFVVTADHGFASVYQEINLHPLFKESGLLDRLVLHPDKWVLHVELNRNFMPDTDASRLDQLLKKAASLPGINRVISSAEYPTYGLPRYEDDPHMRGQYMIVANIDRQLILDPASSSMLSRPSKNPSHGHGYLPSHPLMYPALILSGRGIHKGKQIGRVHNLDVAPTIAYLLGLKVEGARGRVLKEALSTP
jgi:predicted AlkP superfamily pyrophosphatase or phosphodiesterase